MMLTIYERAVALQDLFKEKDLNMCMAEIGLYIPFGASTQVMQNAIIGYKNKAFLIKEKDKALTNLSGNIQEMSDSSATILNLAFETARKSFLLRQNLELSVLTSQLKMLEIESLNIIGMTAEEFETKYGV